MAQTQIKVSVNKTAGAGVVINQHDDTGNDVGEAIELKPGKSQTLTVDEGCSAVVLRGENVELAAGKTAESLIVTVSVEGDSVHNARVQMTSGVADLADVTVSSDKEAMFTLEGEPRIRITRAAKNPNRAEPEPKAE